MALTRLHCVLPAAAGPTAALLLPAGGGCTRCSACSMGFIHCNTTVTPSYAWVCCTATCTHTTAHHSSHLCQLLHDHGHPLLSPTGQLAAAAGHLLTAHDGVQVTDMQGVVSSTTASRRSAQHLGLCLRHSPSVQLLIKHLLLWRTFEAGSAAAAHGAQGQTPASCTEPAGCRAVHPQGLSSVPAPWQWQHQCPGWPATQQHTLQQQTGPAPAAGLLAAAGCCRSCHCCQSQREA